MIQDFEREFWAPIEVHLSAEDDVNLWRAATREVLLGLDPDLADIPIPNRLHFMIAKQSKWWRPHWDPPAMYGGSLNGLNWYEPPDWELHWLREKPRGRWEYRGNSEGKHKGKTAHCLTFVPARTSRHCKISVVQILEAADCLWVFRNESKKTGQKVVSRRKKVHFSSPEQ